MPRKTLFVLSPCGTSLLTNQADNSEKKLVSKYANYKNLEEIPIEDRKILESLCENVEEKLLSADYKLASKMSAELNGIIKLYEGQFNQTHDHHVLLCTDTWLGETTARLVGEWLQDKVLTVEIKRQDYLQTKDITSFQFALSEIVSYCQDTIPHYRDSGYHVVFNLTGGFKSVQGFLQTLATFYADETIYVFETATDLLRIPRIPVKMATEDTVSKNLEVFRRLSLNLPVSTTSNIPETLVMKYHNSLGLSPWGEIVWAQTKRKIYADKLHPSPSKKLEFGLNFERSLKDLSADRLIIINERIDQLVRYLEEGKKYNLPSLDFKPLRNNPCPPSTHEIDAWSDGAAARMFGHYENGCFILNKFDKHL